MDPHGRLQAEYEVCARHQRADLRPIPPPWTPRESGSYGAGAVVDCVPGSGTVTYTTVSRS